VPESALPGSSADRVPWPFRVSAGTIGLVAAGGAVGTLVRYLLTSLVPGGPAVTLAINVTGTFLLGALLERVARSSRPARAAALRMLLGTGLLGGYTTYSALSLETVELGADAGIALLYGIGTLVLGLAAAALGIRMGRR